MVRASVGEAVDQPGIAMLGEDDGFVGGEEGIEIFVRQPVRMLGRWL
jgi:hypothetical protein